MVAKEPHLPRAGSQVSFTLQSLCPGEPDAEWDWFRGSAHQSQAWSLALIIPEIFTAWGIGGECHIFHSPGSEVRNDA